jgi:hypothetical protein
MVWTLLFVAADINVQKVIHIAGVDNEKCDRLSRRGPHSTLSVSEEAAEMGYRGVDVVEVNRDDEMMGVLRLCDPRRIVTTEEEFVMFWSEVREAIAIFLLTHMIHTPMSAAEEERS